MICRIVLIATLCIATVALTSGVAAAQQQEAMNATEFREYLRRLSAATEAWRTRLTNVDVDSLRLEHQEGKILDGRKELAVHTLENLEEGTRRLALHDTLAGEIALLVELENFEAAVGAFVGNLNSPLTMSDSQSQRQSVKWAQLVLSVERESNALEERLYPHVLTIAERLEACGVPKER